MFERYTERARRVIFFARAEAIQSGSAVIETGHLLIGLLRENRNLLTRFATPIPFESIVTEIQERMATGEKSSTSIDIPLSKECQRILAYAAEEAEALEHRHIGTEHLLLGILRENTTMASQILHERGLEANAVRRELSLYRPTFPDLPQAGCVPDAATAMRIAEAIWIPVHGVEEVARQKPLHADLIHNVWHVRGTPLDKRTVLIARISKVDGQVLKTGHD
jgi:ATP-dependent Clp protease ATP-binding subunit ClpA